MFRTHYIEEAKKEIGKKVKIAGWVHDFRDKGKIKFLIIRDISGTIQIILKKGVVSDSLLESVNPNKEDVVSFEGEIKAINNPNGTNSVEMVPSSYEQLGKVEIKLPVDPTGVTPTEIDVRLDNRFIDLRSEIPSLIFQIKATVAGAFREKLNELKFIEIHPSAITGAATEGGTDVFELGYFEKKAYLVQSPQLYKQMVVVGGIDRAMMIVPVFRAEKHNTTMHLNEIYQMDIEMGFANEFDAMNVLESVFLHILNRVNEKHGEKIRAKFGELIIPQKINKYTYTQLVEKLNQNGYSMKIGEDFTKEMERKLFEILNEEAFFIYEWPTAIRAFYSMPKKDNPQFCNAFDLMYRGLEISSGAQRIHIPSLLEEQLRSRGLDPQSFEFYIKAFRSGAPPHAGWSIGLERLTQKICKQDNIRECMLFPRDRVRLNP